MDAKKAVVWGIFAFLIAALAVATFFIVRECKKPRTPKKLLKEDLTLVAKRQEKDKNYKEAKTYMGKADLTEPNQEMAKHAARLADRKALETIKVNSKKEKRFNIKWNDAQIMINACAYGDPALIEMLTGFNCEGEYKDKSLVEKLNALTTKDGKTMLHFAANSGNLDLVKYFEKIGMDLKAKDKRGWQASHFAANSGNLDLVKYLIEEKGFDINAKNGYGETVLDYAKTEAVAAYLKNKGAKNGR